mgnify:CR=1 FL=1
MSECLEAFGGAGYVEDTGIPVLLRDAQVLPIWEGTTNALSLDLLRAMQSVGGIKSLQHEIQRCADAVDAPSLQAAMDVAIQAFHDAAAWLQQSVADEHALQAGARRFALTIGTAMELALTCRHAQWSLDTEQDGRSVAAAERMAAGRISRIANLSRSSAQVLAQDAGDAATAGHHPADNEPRGDGAAQNHESRDAMPLEGDVSPDWDSMG